MTNMFRIQPLIAQSALAGIANRAFCQQMLDLGAGMVTLGGFPADRLNCKASLKMEERGRMEFIPPVKESEFSEWFNQNLLLNKRKNNQRTAVNLRIVTIDQMTEKWLKSLDGKIDFLELNAHCRQKEVLSIGGGEGLLRDLKRLDLLLANISKLLQKTELSIKIRGCSVGDKNTLIKILEKQQVNYIHIDSMLKGENIADIQLLRSYCDSTDIPIIGNNSVRCIEDIKKMIKVGAIAVSVARPLITQPNFIAELIQKLEG